MLSSMVCSSSQWVAIRRLQFLTELDETLVEKLLTLEDSTRIANLIKDASANDQSYILGLLNKSQAKSIIELLKTEEQEEIKGNQDSKSVEVK